MKTFVQKIKELIAPIPQDEFIADLFTDQEGKCCVLGHVIRLTSNDPKDYNSDMLLRGDTTSTAEKLRTESMKFMKEKYDLDYTNIIHANNSNRVNGYTNPSIKDRVMHVLDDMIKAGY